MVSRDRFDSLYDELAVAWSAHEDLRRAQAPIPALSHSAARLFHARLAMHEWLRHNRVTV